MGNTNSAIKAVIWDMGGVLLRTGDAAPRKKLAGRLGTTRQALERLVFGTESAERATRGEIPAEEHWQAIGQALRLSAQELADFQRDFWAGDQIDRELLEFIHGLRPCYRTALLSNAWSDIREAAASRFQFLDAFDVVIFSSEVKLAKPDANIYTHLLDLLEITPAEAVFVDDFAENVEAAARLGMRAVHFTSSDQARAEVQALLEE